MTGDFPELEEAIRKYQARVLALQQQIAELETETSIWRARRDAVRPLLSELATNKVQRFAQYSGYPPLEYYLLSPRAGLDYLNAMNIWWEHWTPEALEEVVAYEEKFREGLKPPTPWHDIRGITETEFNELRDEALGRSEVFPAHATWWPSKHDFRTHKWSDTFVKYVTELVGRGESAIAIHIREVYGIVYMPWITTETASLWRSGLSSQETLATTKYELSRAQLLDTRDSLESVKRALRDAELALESAELEKRRAEALEEAERLAAEERRRVELESISRDLMLGYPEMDATTARIIAELAYQAAIGAAERRYEVALEIARERAREWAKKDQLPGEPTFGPAGIEDWLKKNWLYLAIAGLGTALVVTAATRK